MDVFIMNSLRLGQPSHSKYGRNKTTHICLQSLFICALVGFLDSCRFVNQIGCEIEIKSSIMYVI